MMRTVLNRKKNNIPIFLVIADCIYNLLYLLFTYILSVSPTEIKKSSKNGQIFSKDVQK